MSFLMRILFSGLMVFVPSTDGKEVTVLLLNANHTNHTSDGAAMGDHKPLLIARAGDCTGDCPKRDADIAQYIYADKTEAQALDLLESAVGGGAAWQLAGSDLSIRKSSSNAADLPDLVIQSGVRGTVNNQPQLVPTSSAEREDYSWLADVRTLCGPTCSFKQSVLGSTPPSGLIAARLHLRSGKVFTYSVARIGSNVTPVHFQRLDGTGSVSPYTQAVASWMGADLQIDGTDVTIDEATFAGSGTRTMKLTPDSNGKVEVAVINLPPFVPPTSTSNDSPQVGKHFEKLYDLSNNAPADDARLVPYAGVAGNATYPEVDWASVHPQTELWSELLNQLRLNIGRSAYDRTLCPPGGDHMP